MADGRSYVSTCCELVPGTFFEVGVSQPSPRFGHGLEVSPDGTRLASVGYFELAVRDVEGQPIASIANEAGGADPYAVMWVDDARLAVLHRPADVDETRLSVVSPDTLDTFDDGGTVIPFGGSSSQGAEIQPSMSFAGMSASGAILVLDDDVSDSLLAYDPSTLARRSGDDVASGEYRWARRYD